MTRTPRLAGWARAAVYAVCTALVLTGAAWLVLDTWVRVPGDFGPQHHPLQGWLMRLHGLAAPAALVGLGALLAHHVPLGWRIQHRRLSGAVLLGSGVALAAGGWGLYYVSGETARQWLSISHWVLGLGGPALLAWHIHGARRERLAEQARARRMPGV